MTCVYVGRRALTDSVGPSPWPRSKIKWPRADPAGRASGARPGVPPVPRRCVGTSARYVSVRTGGLDCVRPGGGRHGIAKCAPSLAAPRGVRRVTYDNALKEYGISSLLILDFGFYDLLAAGGGRSVESAAARARSGTAKPSRGGEDEGT